MSTHNDTIAQTLNCQIRTQPLYMQI